jgi:hypothetical protein
MTAQAVTDLFVNTVPFILYTALLGKLLFSWRRVRAMTDGIREARLTAVLLLITVCTLTFMAANGYALAVYGVTFLSLKVFQMFVLANCLAYWLILDLITRDVAPVQS